MLFPAYSVNARRTPAAATLDLRSGGTRARASAAWYWLRAATDGSTPFMASAASGTLRSSHDMGDGLGPSLLMEKSATNYMLNSRAENSWTAGQGTTTANQNGGPLADGGADRNQISSGQYGPYQLAPGPSGVMVGSVWVRQVSGTGVNQIYLFHNSGGSGVRAVSIATTTTYQRNDSGGGSCTTNSGMIASDGRALALPPNTSAPAHAEDVYLDMAQLEAGYYPTSPIDTTGASATRPADTLSYASGAYPSGFLTNGVVIVFAPDASSAEIVSAGEEWRLVQNGGNGLSIIGYNDGVTIRASAGSCVIDLAIAGTIVATKTVTFSRGQALTITAKPSAGSITVAGATTGNGSNTGTGAAWTSGQTMYVGGDAAGALNVTGRYVGAVITEAV